MSKYIERFTSLVVELTAYESRTDPLYYTMRFIDGLRQGIKTVVMVQRPQNLNSTYALALVQEEALESGRRRRIEPITNRTAWTQSGQSSESTKGEHVQGVLEKS